MLMLNQRTYIVMSPPSRLLHGGLAYTTPAMVLPKLVSTKVQESRTSNGGQKNNRASRDMPVVFHPFSSKKSVPGSQVVRRREHSCCLALFCVHGIQSTYKKMGTVRMKQPGPCDLSCSSIHSPDLAVQCRTMPYRILPRVTLPYRGQECNDEVLKAAPETVPWLARLALTRNTVIMPMTNSIGYYNTVR